MLRFSVKGCSYKDESGLRWCIVMRFFLRVWKKPGMKEDLMIIVYVFNMFEKILTDKYILVIIVILILLWLFL